MILNGLLTRTPVPAPLCVCGCPPAAHRQVVMSVPLHGARPARYMTPSVGSILSAARTHPQAAYDRLECACGCGEFLPDPGPE